MKRLLKIYMEKPELAALVLLVMLIAVFQLRSDGIFLTTGNLRGILGILPEIGLMVIGVTIRLRFRFDAHVHGGVTGGGHTVFSGLLRRNGGLRRHRVPKRILNPPVRYSEFYHDAWHVVCRPLFDRRDFRWLSPAIAE